jgi:uncharacterized protein (TIGR02757 family)
MSRIKPEIIELLQVKAEQYNRPDFIENDPICIPHLFQKKEDVEIAGFIAAILAWGQRKTILINSRKFMENMDFAPSDFIRNHTAKERKRWKGFAHRTFNETDCSFFLENLQRIYKKHGGIEQVFHQGMKSNDNKIPNAIHYFRGVFLHQQTEHRSKKHISDPISNSSAKRICMYLRWMVRKDKKGCDFGIWKSISPKKLYLPLDVHTGNIGRKLGLLKRKQNDWKAVEEVTESLKKIDPVDPIRFDFALFGMGVHKDF